MNRKLIIYLRWLSFLGSSVMRSAVCAVAVVVLAGLPSSSVAQTGAFTDSRDGKTYKTVKIGKQTWMARNLDFATDSGSWCYNDSASYCAKYGRLYTWETAKAVCPDGWKLPDTSDWYMLINTAGGEGLAGQKLKSKSGWIKYKGERVNATDTYGFSALSGGFRDNTNNRFGNVGDTGYWWMASERDDNEACSILINYYNHTDEYGSPLWIGFVGKNNGYSVRCVRDVKK